MSTDDICSNWCHISLMLLYLSYRTDTRRHSVESRLLLFGFFFFKSNHSDWLFNHLRVVHLSRRDDDVTHTFLHRVNNWCRKNRMVSRWTIFIVNRLFIHEQKATIKHCIEQLICYYPIDDTTFTSVYFFYWLKSSNEYFRSYEIHWQTTRIPFDKAH
jgi:hypothetical protein